MSVTVALASRLTPVTVTAAGWYDVTLDGDTLVMPGGFDGGVRQPRLFLKLVMTLIAVGPNLFWLLPQDQIDAARLQITRQGLNRLFQPKRRRCAERLFSFRIADKDRQYRAPRGCRSQ